MQAGAEPRASEQQRRGCDARVVRIAADEALEDTRREPVEAVTDRPFTDQIEPVRFLESGDGDGKNGKDQEDRG